MTGAIVDLLQVVAVDDEEAHRSASLLRGGKLALETLLEPPAVQHAGQRVGHGALALPSQCNGGIEGRRDVSGQHGSGVELHRVDPSDRPAGADERADLLAVGTQGQPHERRPIREARLEELAHDRGLDRFPRAGDLLGRERRRPDRLRPPGGELHGRAGLVPEDDLAHLERDDLRERGGPDRRDLVRVAHAADVDEEPREGGQIEGSPRGESVRASGASAAVSAPKASAPSAGRPRSDSTFRTPTTVPPTRSGSASSDKTPGRAET